MDNTDTSHASALFVPDVSEESVDIYDGLDIGFSNTAEEPPSVGSQLKESMDLYEEIVTEEQQSRESSYIELKSRFQAAQNHIRELRRRLEQLELQNTGLRTENHCLKKNISALLQTARKEVTRKDAEIQRLSQWSERVRHHYPAHVKNLLDANSSGHSSTSRLAPPPPPPSSPHLPPLPISPPRGNQPLRDGPQSTRKESDSLPRASSCYSRSNKDREVTDKQPESDKQKSSRGEHRSQSQKSESINRRHKSVSDPNSDYYPHEQNRSHRADKDMGQRYDSRSCKRKSYSCEEHHRSDGAKTSPEISQSTPSDNKKDSRRQDKDKTTASDPEHGTCLDSKGHHSRELPKVKITGGSARSYNSKDWKKSSVIQHAVHCRDSSKEREGARQRDHQWKGERQSKGKISRNHMKNSRSQTSREHEKIRSKESSQGKRDFCDKDRRGKTNKTFKRSFEEDNMSKKSSFGESSPNRKLCFMETLNLTLSPIKKPALATDRSQKDPVPVDRDVENGSDEDNLQPNIEDMCVIDDIENSQLEGELRESAEQSLNNHKALCSERPAEASDVEGIQEKDEGCSETVTANISVQTISALSQPLETAQKQIAAHPTAKSPQNGYLKPDESKNHQENTESISKSEAAECQMVKATNGSDPTDEPGSISASCDLQKVSCENNADLCAAVTKSAVVDSSVETLEVTVQQSVPQDSRTDSGSSHPKKTNATEATACTASPESHHSPLAIKSQVGPRGSPASSNSVHMKDSCKAEDCRKDTDAVSSTISLECLPQEGLSLTEAIYVLTQTDEDTRDSSASTCEPSSSTGCIGVSKVSSTTQEKTQPESYADVTVTPSKHFSPKNGQETKFKCSSSVPLLHDEDSMMRTLSNLKKIPDAISPLRSPVRVMKRSVHVHGKPGHVKCLQKDFSSTPVDASSKKLDVNKENKYPGSPAQRDPLNLVDKVSDLPSAHSDTDLEEGEILSESDEVSASSPATAAKRAKLVQPVTNKSSPKCALKKKFAEKRVASKESHEIADVTTQSPRSRFKTVCPAASKAAFCTIDEVMETFQLVRTEIRKKYMKLHKTFPKKSFYGMMDNFQRSFLEFVDGAHFGEICDQPGELKSKLKKLIESVFGKVSNNGIVKRIFEQQAVDLKQKLWDFVNVQVDYLFVDIHTALKGFCKPSGTQPEDKRASEGEKVSQQLPARKPSHESDRAQPASAVLNQTKSSAVVPYKTGLGSRGKDIRITHVEKDKTAVSHPLNPPCTKPIDEFLPPQNPPSTPEKNNPSSSLVVAQNGSFDKTDFELLTEQQASSLTFNLVRDSQMGEIFKCLLQGSDLLESNGITGDNSTWSLSTPRKDGERFISINTPSKSPSKLLSPIKFDTPSKLIATWSSISPRKMSSPHPKDQATLNPALLDENCLLEVPSENRALSSLASQKSYSLLAEDLAVSLTIPSPLKSDSHLSFLQPTSLSMHIVSTPENVIRAHISEDALLDGEDATEHDIHLALDTDNSSCGSSSSVASETPATSFVLKPDMTMQALVMEKSNDHFIVKIRQANPGADGTLTAEESLSETLIDEQHTERDVAAQDDGADVADKLQKALPSECSSSATCSADTESSICLTQVQNLTLLKDRLEDASTQQNTSKDSFSKESLKNLPEASPSDHSLNSSSEITVTPNERQHFSKENTTPEIPSKTVLCKSQSKILPSKAAVSNISRPSESSLTNLKSQESFSLDEPNDVDISESEKSLTIAEDTSSSPEKEQRDSNKGRKRKQYPEKSKAKKIRMEKESTQEEEFPSQEADEDSKSFSMACLSPSSLSAKNVIRRKGEVVMAWTRDEDRAILMDMKTKGASRETFSALSEKLNKPSGQIAHRFYQLMKLFKKMDA